MSDQGRGPTSPSPSSGSANSETIGTLIRLSDSREFTVGVGGLRVGRQKKADIVLGDRTVSRHHADVRYENGRYVLYDHSSNGTWVNDVLVVVAKPLRNGDRVKFGSVEFRFELRDADQAEARGAGAPVESVREASTLRMKGGKPWKKRGGSKVWVILGAVLVVLLAAAAVVYFFFPELADRWIGSLPPAVRSLLGGS